MACGPGAIHWIEVVFNDCIITPKDKVSFAIGLFSNIIFLVSSIPQIVLTCRTRCVEGQSPWFFSLLFLASICSLLGAIITNGLITQILQSVFYVLMDGILFAQLICFRYVVKPKTDQEEDGKEEEEIPEIDSGGADPTGVPPAVLAGSVLVAAAEAKTDFKAPYTGGKLAGTLFGWVSTIIFIASRVPQIVKNCRERSFGDISAVWLIFSIVGNLAYFLSVIVRDTSGTYLWRQTPFILGALGPAALDIFLMIQMCAFRKSKTEEESPVREEEDHCVEGNRIEEF